MHFPTILLPLLITTTLALPQVSQKRGYPIALGPRQSCAETCGTVCYIQSVIDEALNEGYQLYQNGETEGSGSYPHTYNNYEGFTFPVSGPYQEFPILKSDKDYTGGSPGPDRVIFNENGDLAGVITHTGATGNDFVACDDGSGSGSGS